MKKSFLFSALCLLSACASLHSQSEPNSLTAAEKREGWKLLFDGTSTAGWHSVGKETFPTKGWVVENGALRKIARERGGDIVTEKTYSEFDLRFDWKIGPRGNNGVKYFVTPERRGVGHEFQLLDDLAHSAGKDNGVHSTASFYEVLAPFTNKVAALK